MIRLCVAVGEGEDSLLKLLPELEVDGSFS